MKRGAFALVEFLVVLAILVFLAALLQPVFVKAMTAAKMAKSKSYLKQIGQATVMYQTNAGGAGIYGDAWRMGLPPGPQPDHLPILNALKPPMNDHPSVETIGSSYKQIFVGGTSIFGKEWSAYAQEAQDASVIFVDPFFNPTQLDLANAGFYSLHFIGVRLDTSILTIEKRGEWMIPSFWHDYYRSTH